MGDRALNAAIERVWAEVERLEADADELREDLVDAECELEGLYAQLAELRYQQGERS
jgi:chromosome segregation ATPase